MCGTPECYSATAASICIVGNEDCDKGEKKDTLYHVGWFLVSVGFGSVVLCEYGLVLYTEPATTGQYRPRQNPAQRAAMRLEIYLRMDVTSKMEIIFRAWVRSDMLHVQELGSISARVLSNQSVRACELGIFLLLGVSGTMVY